MKIIVVGDGKVGFAIAKQLNQEGHDITVVENKANVLSSTMNQLDIVGVQGNGASLDTLLEARVPSSDLLIAATSTDEVNIICCLLAKKYMIRGLRLIKNILFQSKEEHSSFSCAIGIIAKRK